MRSTASTNPVYESDLDSHNGSALDSDWAIPGDGPEPDETSVDRKLRARDDEDLGLRFGLPPAPRPELKYCRNALILSLLVAMETGRDGVFYSRDRNVYAREKLLGPDHWTYANVVTAVADLERAPGFFRHIRQPPRLPISNSPRRRSSIAPGPDLLAFDTTKILFAIPLRSIDRIEVRDSRKRPKAYKPTLETHQTEAFLRRFDEALEALVITFDHPSAREIAPGIFLLKDNDRMYRVNTRVRALVRIFNGTLKSGGRLYRGFWQGLPKGLRGQLRIDGSPVVEHDFATCHPRLVYAAAGLDWPFGVGGRGDAYHLPGTTYDRGLVKKVTSVLWNTRSHGEAVGAIARALHGADFDSNRQVAAELIKAVKIRHRGVEEFFHSNRGKALQFVDSQILMLCLDRLLDQGIVGLPIHDSIVAAAEHQATLVEIMQHTFDIDGQILAQQRFSWLRGGTGFCGHDLTMGEGSLEVVGGVSVGGCTVEDPRCAGPFASIYRVVSQALGPSRPAIVAQTTQRPHDTITSIDEALGDLLLVVGARRRLSSGIIRTILLLNWMRLDDVEAAIAQASPMLSDLTTLLADRASPETVADEIERFRRHRQTPIRPASAANLCGVTLREADTLRLKVLRPHRRQARSKGECAERRRAKTWDAGTIPRIVDVEKARPWDEDRQCRSHWRTLNKGSADLQLLALYAHIKRREVEPIAKIRDEIQEAKRIRDAYCSSEHLPVDDLVDKLDNALRTYNE